MQDFKIVYLGAKKAFARRNLGTKKATMWLLDGGCYRTRTYDPLLVRQML